MCLGNPQWDWQHQLQHAAGSSLPRGLGNLSKTVNAGKRVWYSGWLAGAWHSCWEPTSQSLG